MAKGEQNPGSPQGPPLYMTSVKMHSRGGAGGEGSSQGKNHSCAHHGDLQSLHKLTDSRQEPEREEMAVQELKNRKKLEPWRREREESTGTRTCTDSSCLVTLGQI